jgi:hypothetical protein
MRIRVEERTQSPLLFRLGRRCQHCIIAHRRNPLG